MAFGYLQLQSLLEYRDAPGKFSFPLKPYVLLGLELVPALQMHDEGLPLGKTYSLPKIQAACE